MFDLAALALYVFVMSITPGPNNVMLTASGVNFGFLRTMPHMGGISLGFAAQTILTALGFGVVFARVPQLQTWLAWIGAAYLCYLAWRLLAAGTVAAGGNAKPLTSWQAAAFQFVNPKAWVMCITICALFLPKGAALTTSLPILFGVIVAVNFPCLMVWAAFGEVMRRVLSEQKWRVVFNIAMAALLAGTAISMVWPPVVSYR